MSLDFTELSQFKHLVHLSLVVLKATDSQLKDYLVDSLVTLKREKEMVEGELGRHLANLMRGWRVARASWRQRAVSWSSRGVSTFYRSNLMNHANFEMCQ